MTNESNTVSSEVSFFTTNPTWLSLRTFTRAPQAWNHPTSKHNPRLSQGMNAWWGCLTDDDKFLPGNLQRYECPWWSLQSFWWVSGPWEISKSVRSHYIIWKLCYADRDKVWGIISLAKLLLDHPHKVDTFKSCKWSRVAKRKIFRNGRASLVSNSIHLSP